jgi:hypothetical protein
MAPEPRLPRPQPQLELKAKSSRLRNRSFGIPWVHDLVRLRTGRSASRGGGRRVGSMASCVSDFTGARTRLDDGVRMPRVATRDEGGRS